MKLCFWVTSYETFPRRRASDVKTITLATARSSFPTDWLEIFYFRWLEKNHQFRAGP